MTDDDLYVPGEPVTIPPVEPDPPTPARRLHVPRWAAIGGGLVLASTVGLTALHGGQDAPTVTAAPVTVTATPGPAETVTETSTTTATATTTATKTATRTSRTTRRVFVQLPARTVVTTRVPPAVTATATVTSVRATTRTATKTRTVTRTKTATKTVRIWAD